MRLRSLVLFTLTASTAAAGCNQYDQTPLSPIIAVSITPQSPPATNIGATVALAAEVLGTSNQVVLWTTSSSAIATVNGNGLVTCVAAGTATITASPLADPSKTASVSVTCRVAVQIQVNTTSLAFTHAVGSSPCPQAIGPVQVTNNSPVAVTVTLTGHSALSVDAASFTLDPGASRTIAVSFNCSTQDSFAGTVVFTASGSGASDAKTVQVTGTINR